MVSLRENQRGETAVALLVGIALIGAAAATATVTLKKMRSQAQFSHSTGTALAIESFLLAALQKPTTYAEGAADKLASGQKPTGLRFEMENSGTRIPVAIVGTRTLLTEEGRPCHTEPCALRTDIDIACAGTLCRAAYRIEINPATTKLSIPPLGAASWPPSASDYTQLLDFDLYRRQGQKFKCDPGELFVGGMNRSAGTVSCVGATTRRLAGNEIGKGVRYSAATKSLEYTALTLKRGHCPPRYVAQRIDPQSFEASPSGTCIYRYKSEVPWLKPWPANQEKVSGRFCPLADYKTLADGKCKGSVVSTTNGYCSKTCVDAKGNSYECGHSTKPDTSFKIEQSINNSGVSCALVKTGKQECGADWKGAVHWAGSCKLKLAETVDMSGE